MRNRRFRVFRVASIAVIVGTCLLMGGCGDVGGFVSNFNPCGTILNCDPVTYRFISSGYQGPGVDPDVDPSCTYPPFCGDPSNPDPFVYSQ